MYKLDLQSVDDIFQSLKKLSLKHKDLSISGLISLDIKGVIDEYCNFINALTKCRTVAEDEYSKITQEMGKITSLKNNVHILQEQLNNIATVNDVQLGDDAGTQEECSNELKSTMEFFSKEFMKAIDEIETHINKEAEELKKFKVVLFGRTKAGKSTVREALTQGNGETIGKGGQSTTLQIHPYNWYNLQVYDTPGILSSKDTNVDAYGIGDEERKANELLMRSDVALFMFASDNIEQPELEYLRQVVDSGKEVLILLNVKSDISDYRMYKLRKKEKELSLEAQSGHVNRITQIAGSHLEILPIHAQAAFFSRAKNNGDIEEFFQKYGIGRNELYELSRFGAIRNFLVKNILGHGMEIRCRTLWDYFISQIRTFAKNNRIPVESCKDKILRMQGHIVQTDKKIEGIISRYSNDLKSKIRSLAQDRIDTYDYAYDCIEYGYKKDAIKDGWEEKLEALNDIPGIIVKEFVDEIQELIKELSDNIEFELNSKSQFEGYENQRDWSGVFKGAGIVSGLAATGLGVYALVAATNAWHPGGWLLIGLGVLSAAFAWIAGIFKSKTTKIRELQEKLDESLDTCCSSIAEQLSDYLNDNIFCEIREKMKSMRQAQDSMLSLCDRFLELNDSLLSQADQHEHYLIQRLKDFS